MTDDAILAGLAKLEGRLEAIKEDTARIPELCKVQAEHAVKIATLERNAENFSGRVWAVVVIVIGALITLATRVFSK